MEERLYATQMEAARKGIVTKELEIVAKKEKMATKNQQSIAPQDIHLVAISGIW